MGHRMASSFEVSPHFSEFYPSRTCHQSLIPPHTNIPSSFFYKFYSKYRLFTSWITKAYKKRLKTYASQSQESFNVKLFPLADPKMGHRRSLGLAQVYVICRTHSTIPSLLQQPSFQFFLTHFLSIFDNRDTEWNSTNPNSRARA
jgi:hypothetical protein